GGDGPSIEDGDAAHGAELYQQMCAACHGLLGEGGVGPALAGWSRPADELISIIDETMPTQNPAVCTGTCPVDVAAYILEGFGGDCSGTPAGPRQLRLLTRREYNATVRDLLDLGAGSEPPTGQPCAVDSDCQLASESCVDLGCAADACGLHTFIYDPAGQSYGSVFVSGSFNGWAPTVAEGGWPLAYDGAAGVWYGKFDLANGSHSYKFVLDDSQWIADPQNPDSEDDGFGGQNSLLDISCGGGGGGGDTYDFAAGFPVESRPQGYGYDNNAASALVTSVHVDQQLLAAREVASVAVGKLDSLLSCDPNADAQGCARTFVTDFGRRAFRRPLEQSEIDKYANLILGEASFSEGVEVALQVMLTSPYFLYRFEIGSDQADGSAR
ncbi:MAG: DUF1595 domain-containing protein, partial [Myxococcales bacterium]|nr:DUF1595 domain-containing protein [Myxococcales bacterium]